MTEFHYYVRMEKHKVYLTVLKDTLPVAELVQSALIILPILIVVQAIMLPF